MPNDDSRMLTMRGHWNNDSGNGKKEIIQETFLRWTSRTQGLRGRGGGVPADPRPWVLVTK